MYMSFLCMEHVKLGGRWTFQHRRGNAYVENLQYPEAAVAYHEAFMTKLVADCGFPEVTVTPGETGQASSSRANRSWLARSESGQREQIRQGARGEVCLGAGRAARFGVTVPSTRRLPSPVADAGCDLPLPRPFKGAILASKPRASGECPVTPLLAERIHRRHSS